MWDRNVNLDEMSKGSESWTTHESKETALEVFSDLDRPTIREQQLRDDRDLAREDLEKK